MDVATVVDFLPLQKGSVRQEAICFNEEWCKKFFELSGDQNRSLHCTTSGRGVVQGVAIMTKIGTLISESMPGYMVLAIEDRISFGRPVFVGNTLSVETQRLDDHKKITKILVQVLLNGTVLSKMVMTLGKEELLDRKRA